MSMYGKNHYNIVISLQLLKINGKKKENTGSSIKNSLEEAKIRWHKVQ